MHGANGGAGQMEGKFADSWGFRDMPTFRARYVRY